MPVLLVRGEDGSSARSSRVPPPGARGRAAAAGRLRVRGTLRGPTTIAGGSGLPDRASFESLRLEHRSLTPLPAHERHGLLLVLPTPGRSFDPEDVLRGIGPQLESFGIGAMHRVDTREMRVAANWKLTVDTGMEVYHVAFLHKDTVGPRNIGNTQTFETFGLHQRMAIPAPSILTLRDLPEREWGDPMQHFQLVHNLFPSTGLVIASELVALTRSDPGSHVGETSFRLSTYAWQRPESESDQNLARLGFECLYHVVSTEDYRVAAQAQKSFESERGRSVLIGRNEIGIQALHRSYDALLGS